MFLNSKSAETFCRLCGFAINDSDVGSVIDFNIWSCPVTNGIGEICQSASKGRRKFSVNDLQLNEHNLLYNKLACIDIEPDLINIPCIPRIPGLEFGRALTVVDYWLDNIALELKESCFVNI